MLNNYTNLTGPAKDVNALANSTVLLLTEDFIDVPLAELETDLDEVMVHMDQLDKLFTVLKAAPYLTSAEAKLTGTLINAITEQYHITVPMPTLFTAQAEKLVPSLEGIEFTWKEIFKFVSKLTRLIVDGIRSFFNKQFTLIGVAHKTSRSFLRNLKKMDVLNVDSLQGSHVTPTQRMLAVYAKTGGVASLELIENELREQARQLDPKAYHSALESYIATLAGFSGEDTTTLLDIAEKARKNVILHVRQYLGASSAYTTKLQEGYVSPSFLGGYQYQVSYANNGLAAPAIKLVQRPPKTSLNAKVPCLVPNDAASLMAAVAEALKLTLELRAEYDNVRNFKKRADNATKALSLREGVTGTNADVLTMYRSIPSYVRLFSAPLKTRTELIYAHSLAILSYVSVSRREWKISLK